MQQNKSLRGCAFDENGIGRVGYDGSVQRGRSVSPNLRLPCFVCEPNMSRTAERSCTKFTGKTCLVPRSNDVEGQGPRSKVKVTSDKNRV